MIKHHKFINRLSELNLRFISLSYDKYSVILRKDSSNFFESKVKYYYRLLEGEQFFYDPVGKTYRSIQLNELLSEDMVRFDLDIQKNRGDNILRVCLVIENEFFKRHRI